MGVTVGGTWAGIESVVSAGDKAVGIYNAGGAASGQALTDAAIGLMAATSALASNFPMGSLAEGSDVINNINQLNLAIASGNPDQIMLAVAGPVGSVAGFGAVVLPPPYNASAAAISIAATIGKQIIQNGNRDTPIPSFTFIDPQTLNDQGLINPKTLPPTTAISPILGTTPDPLVKTIHYVDPLVLDLDGDGLEITPLAQSILFDANGDAIKTATAWVGKGDGLLAWDRDANGSIDSGRELFGDETILSNGSKAAHGFAALAELDTGSVVNGVTVGAGDGVFDANDSAYSAMRVWTDVNQDGISQAAELHTLADSGVSTITLASTAPTPTTATPSWCAAAPSPVPTAAVARRAVSSWRRTTSCASSRPSPSARPPACCRPSRAVGGRGICRKRPHRTRN